MYHGVLLVDKPSGLTSHDVVARLRKILKTKEVGHCGTLDPLATGLLVAVLGEGTKLSPYLSDQEKQYAVEVRLGFQTDTLDITGKVVETCDVKPSKEKIVEGVKSLTGTFDWPVPMYSAAKVNGKKLYELAREGRVIDTPKKQMSFTNINIQDISDDRIDLIFDLSKGSFVRTWVDFFGYEVGTRATVSQLRRLTSGIFNVAQAKTLSELELMSESELQNLIHDPSSVLMTRSLYIDENDERKLRNGLISFELKNKLISAINDEVQFSAQVLSRSSKKLIALLDFIPYKGFKIGRILNY